MQSDNLSFSHVFFLGIGGIGVSALAFYCLRNGKTVLGYDREKSEITRQLEQKGVRLFYKDNKELISREIEKKSTLVCFSSAISPHNSLYNFFFSEGFRMIKRAKFLGFLSSQKKCIAIAGTHGKTTTSAITAHLFYHSQHSCSAFVGGIMNNYGTNHILNPKSTFMVCEADEYDRSFLTLSPYSASINSLDYDHSDIYRSKKEFEEAFVDFATHIDPKGILILHESVSINVFRRITKKIFTFGKRGTNHYSVKNFRSDGMRQFFEIRERETRNVVPLVLDMPGIYNVFNAVCACIHAKFSGISWEDISKNLKTFTGIERRFQILCKNPWVISDYAHHPAEVDACIKATKSAFPNQKIQIIFQPHLFSRTKDFLTEFAEVLSNVDIVKMLPIYAAREKPIEGITSDEILKRVKTEKELVNNSLKLELIDGINLFVGAGSVHNIAKQILNYA